MGLLTEDRKPLACVHPAAISPGSCTQATTRARKIQDRTAASTCWSLDLQMARLPLAAVVFKLDNCFTRLPCGLLWGPVTGKRIFHPRRSKLDDHHQ